MAKSKTVAGIALAAFLAGGTGGIMISQDNYAENTSAQSVPARSFTKEHIDSLEAGERLDNIVMRNGKIIHHWYHTFKEKPHAPTCLKFEVR